MDPAHSVRCVVLAGGRGTRAWPLARRSLPKQCVPLPGLDPGGAATLLEAALRRARAASPARPLVVTGPDMEAAVRALAGDAAVLVEPSPRDTLAPIAWGAAAADAEVVVAMPSDHLVADEGAFLAALDTAVAAARADARAIVTLGVSPTRPETGFGWIEVGEGTGIPGAHVAARFVEKPPAAVAAALLAGGRHRWNAGVFVFQPVALRAAVERSAPGCARAWGGLAAGGDLAAAWAEIEPRSIDYAVMERAERVRVVPVDCGWSDVGSWEAIGSAATAIEAVDASGNVVHAPGKLVALLGVEDLVVVDTPDALLVARRDRAQDVRQVVAALEKSGRTRYT